MTQKELVSELKTVTRNVAYLKFSTAKALPFIVFGLPDDDVYHADDSHYFSVRNGWLELYMESMEFDLIKAVEEVFTRNRMPWEKENEAYIEEEQVFYARWNFQLL